MALPSQHISRFDELYDLLCDKMGEDIRMHGKEVDMLLDGGASGDELQAFEVAYREKWEFMYKLIDAKPTHVVSKATLKAVRDILGDELDNYL